MISPTPIQSFSMGNGVKDGGSPKVGKRFSGLSRNPPILACHRSMHKDMNHLCMYFGLL